MENESIEENSKIINGEIVYLKCSCDNPSDNTCDFCNQEERIQILKDTKKAAAGLTNEIIEAEGWVMYEEGDIHASFSLPNGSDLLWWKPNNHCEMDAPDKYDILYRGEIPNKKALQDLMSWMDIKNRSNG